MSNRFVAFFDVLGWKQHRINLGSQRLLERYQKSVLPFVQYAAGGEFKEEVRGGTPVSVAAKGPASVEMLVVSDSVIFYAEDDSFDSFRSIQRASYELIRAGFGVNMPIRGAIGFGDFFREGNSTMVGSALENAYDWEARQSWAGAVWTPEADAYSENCGYWEAWDEMYHSALKREDWKHSHEKYRKALKRFVTYDVPVGKEDSTMPLRALDWSLEIPQGMAEKSFLPPNCDRVVKIICNTLEFEAFCRGR